MAAYSVTTANTRIEFDTIQAQRNSAVLIDANHIINFWDDSDVGGSVQVFTVNTTTWAMTTSGAVLTFDTNQGDGSSCCKVDDTHFINFWYGGASTSDGFAQIFAVNTTTWAVTTAAARIQFETDNEPKNACYQVDTNHFINLFRGADGDGFAQIFTVNTTTWAVATNARLEFDTENCPHAPGGFKIDATHVLCVWLGGSSATNGFAQVLTVNTTTWAVTTAAARLTIDYMGYLAVEQIDTNHFIIDYTGSGDTSGYSQVITVNTTTWEITTSGARFQFETSASCSGHQIVKVDANHCLAVWSAAGDTSGAVAVTLTINTTTWAVVTTVAKLKFETSQAADDNSLVRIDTSHYAVFYSGVGSDGFTEVLAVEGAPSGPANLKTYNTNAKANIKTINTNVIANVKTLNTNA